MLLRSLVVLTCVAVISGQRKYYNLHDMPETNFDCRDKILGGYYADPETNCQMFHVCVKIPGQGVQDFRFLCPNETSFDQENQICADSGDIDCEAAGLYLENFDLYRIGSAQAAKKQRVFTSSKGTVIPLGPSTKSPILTNNINEDDEFFLQRSDTGDRRLHSKDLLRGSSSSNFFNNRNKGKDLEDDDDEENIPKANHEYRPKSSHPVRGKSQYSSQFRKSETTAPPQQSTTQQQSNPNQIPDKKRTKIAVRKLTRKRPQSPEEAQDLKTTSQPNYSTFTTQVTQKFHFGEQEQRYNTINRVSTTPSTVSTQNRFQSNFRAKTESSSTLAFFEPSPTPKAFSENKEINKELPTVNLQRQPIVAAAAPQNFQNTPTRPATNFQPPFRQTTAVANQSPAQNFQQNKQTTPTVNVNFQQNRPNPPVNNNFQQNRVNSPPNNNVQQNRPNPPVNNNNFQQNRPNPPVNTNNNFQQNRPNPPVNNNNNNNFQQRPNPPVVNNNVQQNRPTTPGNFQPNRQTPQVTFQPVRQTPAPNNPQNFQQRSNQQQNFQQRQNQQQNFQQNRSPAPTPLQNRPTTVSTAINSAQTINNALQSTRPTASPQNLRQYYNRQFDDFEEGDNQEFLKTAPSSNFRPSDINSFKNNFKTNENFDKNNVTKFASTATTKYYTPTIVTTPKPSPTFSTKDTSNNKFFSTNQPSSSFYTPTITASTKLFKPPSSTLQPPSSGPQPRPFSTTQNQPISSSAKPAAAKDTSYDYAYYDDAGSFSEYDALDALGETDFTRTSQRTKSRLI